MLDKILDEVTVHGHVIQVIRVSSPSWLTLLATQVVPSGISEVTNHDQSIE
jgi:hypothetical protein